MKRRPFLILGAAAALAGCRAKEITPIDRAESANDVSEAEFAVTMKDWPRAEGLFAKAVEVCPDEADNWLNLGAVRMRMHDNSGARSAYKSALSAYADAFERDPTNSAPLLRRAYVLVLLGRVDDARSLIDKARDKYPDDRELRNFVEMKGVDRMVADPNLKELSP
jgi:tetratricopeptide (TPR) repeat protein